MINLFDNLYEVQNVRKKCYFCNGDMDFALCNFMGIKTSKLSKQVYLQIKLKNNIFEFPFEYSDEFTNIKSKISINSITNLCSIEMLSGNNQIYDNLTLLSNFDKANFRLEIWCSNKKCIKKYNYGLFTDSIMMDDTEDPNIFKISKTSISIEGFYLNNFWIQNDWNKDKLYIYSSNHNVEPITSKKINLENFHIEKLKNRIKTIVNFY